MIVLTKGQTQDVILTLTEKQLITNPNYLFVFTGCVTNKKVKFVKLNAADISLYKDRYNKFSFTVNTLFPNEPIQEYLYEVYEQTSTTNTDPTGLNLLETGIMKLLPASFGVYTEPVKDTEFIIPT